MRSAAATIAATIAALLVPPSVHAQARDVLDALVQGDRLVTVERTPCTTAQEPFGALQCASLVARDVATDAERWRTPLPFPLRGLLQIDEASTDAGAGLLVRAHGRGAIVDPTGAIVRTLEVPTSALPRPVAFDEARGALVFTEGTRCAALVASRSDPTIAMRLHGVESHVYRRIGEPHDTVCFGFSVTPVGELRVGTRPAGRGRRGEVRHGLSALVVLAVRGLAEPLRIGPPTLIAVGPSGIVWQRALGSEDAMLESVTMSGTGAHALCTAVTRRGDVRVELSFDCLTGRASSSGPAAAVDVGGQTLPAATYDRHGMVIFPSQRCVHREEGGTHRVIFDGHAVLETPHPILVLDQRGDVCVALETPPSGGDRLHRFLPPRRP
jgi:hypothetical protein